MSPARKLLKVLLPREKPYLHQVKAFKRLVQYHSWALLMEPGCGKTLCAVAAMAYWFLKRKVKRVLVIAPRAPLGAWLRDFPKTSVPIRYELLDGEDGRKVNERGQWFTRRRRDSPHLQVALINWEVVADLKKQIARWKPDLIIFDESQRLQSPRSRITKAMAFLADKTPFRLILTGTPISNSHLSMWGQYRFMDARIFGKAYKAFEDEYAEMHGFFKRKVKRLRRRKKLIRLVHSKATRVLKADCLDLPPEVHQFLEVPLKESRSTYKEMWRDLITTIEGVDVVSPIVLTKILKCQQICGGFVKTTPKGQTKPVVLACGREKLRVLEQWVKDFDSRKKLVVFARFLAEIEAIVKLMKESGRSVSSLTGETRGRIELVRSFQETETPNVLVAQNRTGGEGIDLFRADTAIFYSKSHSYLEYEQMKARLSRPGANGVCTTFVHLHAYKTIDEDIHEAVESKRNIADVILDRMVPGR